MEHKIMNVAKNMAIGIAVGTAMTAAGAMYLNENKSQAKKALNKVKEGKRIISNAGESIVREFTE